MLTNLEMEVLVGAAHGETVKQTADRLSYSHWYIADIRKSVLAKVGARNMAQAVHMIGLGTSRGITLDEVRYGVLVEEEP